MMQNYQEAFALAEALPQAQEIAKIGAVYADGVSLLFDGAGAPSVKHYRCNASVKFVAGQRVKVKRISGTYLVEYPIGAPI